MPINLPRRQPVVFDPIALGQAMAAPAMAKAQRRTNFQNQVFGLPGQIADIIKAQRAEALQKSPISKYMTPEELQRAGILGNTPINIVKELAPAFGNKGSSLEDQLMLAMFKSKEASKMTEADRQKIVNENLNAITGIAHGLQNVTVDSTAHDFLINEYQSRKSNLRPFGIDLPDYEPKPDFFDKVFKSIGSFLKQSTMPVSPAQPTKTLPMQKTQNGPTPISPQSGQGKVYNSPLDVKADYKAGRISKEQARNIILQKFSNQK